MTTGLADQDDVLVPIYFSDVFEVDEQVVDDYGAFNVALVNDLPLFVDPFLLFDSEGDKYKKLHDGIIEYLVFLKERSLEGELSAGDTNQWLLFKEVKQNWLGFSQVGNGGTGLGPNFARSLATNLRTVFRDFGRESTTASSHLEPPRVSRRLNTLRGLSHEQVEQVLARGA